MVRLTRMNGKPLVINALMIEMMEETPDTVITLINGKKIMVLEKEAAVTEMVEQFLKRIGAVQATIKSANTEGL
ncbi:flagellar FlbD family protein [Paenibacillus sp. UNC499MF]|uniref:flagellar FlbD family protein n=1 Tax=Paenibacillus sp. UNC499MF TaxID=1502751 RepID=UPI0008A02F38|nr:flagellar FlbD family protein [Paenibacillus sp. UNC499MF]SEF58015.1 flagellar protein FlbD [Paenibacillus sp. UNC499MF]